MMTPASYEATALGPNEAPHAHEFASPRYYSLDLALLNYLLQDLRVMSRQIAAGDTRYSNYDEIEWEVHGLRRRTVLCDVDALIEPVERLMVGFFGSRRADTPGVNVDELELNVVGEFRHYPGIISYSSIELVNNQWANLVVHQRVEDRTDWRHSQVHISAAETLAPKIYHNVRIHNGCIPSGPTGSGTVEIHSTKYWDYDTSPPWHALRELPEAATGGPDGADA